jgi:xanthine dehydrogenase iron-sulfur cluster and FAD-binding subunit A
VARLPRVDIPEIVVEIAARTGFAEAFTHLTERTAHLAALGRHIAAHLLTLAGTGAGNWHHANSADRGQSDSIGAGHR